jgi:DNA-binding IclR family transcriptional regulator
MKEADFKVIRALESRQSLDALQIASETRMPPSEARSALQRLSSAGFVKPFEPKQTISIETNITSAGSEQKHKQPADDKKTSTLFQLPTRFQLDRDALVKELKKK